MKHTLAILIIALSTFAGCSHRSPQSPGDTPQQTHPAPQRTAHAEPINC
jgi:hypothetical protein